MPSTPSRSASTSKQSHATQVRKTSSFLSLRREKGGPVVASEERTPHYTPHSKTSSYFDAYPRAQQTPGRYALPQKSAPSHESSPGTPSTPEDYGPFSSNRTRAISAESSLAFPAADDLDRPAATLGYLRARSATGPSGVHSWMDSTPQLRFSGSSTQQSETPPDTPVDNSFILPVVVSAPVSGVETMDALVDGMNGGEVIGHSNHNHSRFGIPNHHPLYQPPLPVPPPGVVLGGGKTRRSKPKVKPPPTRSSLSDDDEPYTPPVRPARRKPRSNRSATKPSSGSEHTSRPSLQEKSPTPPASSPSSLSDLRKPSAKSSAPSISDIIRTYAPKTQQQIPILTRSSSSYGHAINEESEVEEEKRILDSEVSRSSIDSVAYEVQQTLKSHATSQVAAPLHLSPSLSSATDHMDMVLQEDSTLHPSASPATQYPASPDSAYFSTIPKPSASQTVAQYLRSARLTTLLKLTRSPHASADNPLTVSLSDLGSATGFPVVVFLGLGCVRHIMGLYDEMAQCLGLRLITIDRWGLGRTEPRLKSAKGIMQWAGVVEEVLDLLGIEECSIMAHSAGSPYALSFASQARRRIRGSICLLAPWVGGTDTAGYKWLKYVPNGILKTAQAAEWKLQEWMIGKPPTLAYEGIGYNAETSKRPPSRGSSPQSGRGAVYPSLAAGRPSLGSSSFSEYDDLHDFEGRFGSHSTLGTKSAAHTTTDHNAPVARRKNSGFLNRFKGPNTQQPQEKQQPVRKLKSLRSMSSLKSKSSRKPEPEASSPQLPPPSLKIDVGLGLDSIDWNDGSSSTLNFQSKYHTTGHASSSRSSGRRSTSFTSSPRPTLSMPASPTISTQSTVTSMGDSYQAALGAALIAASHAESAKGTHNDLLQILNHDNHPWGFSYTSYPHMVRVWYGDKDEKIAENAVRWMEKTMGYERCYVKLVRGADHGLMYKSSVVVEVLEEILTYWQ